MLFSRRDTSNSIDRDPLRFERTQHIQSYPQSSLCFAAHVLYLSNYRKKNVCNNDQEIPNNFDNCKTSIRRRQAGRDTEDLTSTQGRRNTVEIPWRFSFLKTLLR